MFTTNDKRLTQVLADLRAEEYEAERQHDAVRTAPCSPSSQADQRVTCDAPANAAAGVREAAAGKGAIILLSPPERRFLYDLLNAKIPALQHEIHHTEARALRTVLRAELGMAIALTERVGADLAAEALPLNRAACVADHPAE